MFPVKCPYNQCSDCREEVENVSVNHMSISAAIFVF